jgi:hypothetical protein
MTSAPCLPSARTRPHTRAAPTHPLLLTRALLSLCVSRRCNAARACKRLVAEAAVAALKAEVGEEAWDKLTEQQRTAKGKVYVGECHAHLRNIVINAMSMAATNHLKEELADSLAEFSSFDRMSVDGNDLIRAVFKEFHEGGEYAKVSADALPPATHCRARLQFGCPVCPAPLSERARLAYPRRPLGCCVAEPDGPPSSLPPHGFSRCAPKIRAPPHPTTTTPRVRRARGVSFGRGCARTTRRST